ncbi:MAG: hypothetical protein ACH346_02915 [Chthoniobacterales bacterium]
MRTAYKIIAVFFFCSQLLQAGDLIEKGSPENYSKREEKVVTAADYSFFLNSVASSDPYHLFNQKMIEDPVKTGVIRHGAPGSYNYSVILGYENNPIFYVTKIAQACYCNWLENSRLSGSQGVNSIKEGTYRVTNEGEDSRCTIILEDSNADYCIAGDVFLNQENGLLASCNNSFAISLVSFSSSLTMINPAEAVISDSLIPEELLIALGIVETWMFDQAPIPPPDAGELNILPPRALFEGEEVHPLEKMISLNVNNRFYYDELEKQKERLEHRRKAEQLDAQQNEESKSSQEEQQAEAERRDSIGNNWLSSAKEFLNSPHDLTTEQQEAVKAWDKKLIKAIDESNKATSLLIGYNERLNHLKERDDRHKKWEKYENSENQHGLALDEKKEVEGKESRWFSLAEEDFKKAKEAFHKKLKINSAETLIKEKKNKLSLLQKETLLPPDETKQQEINHLEQQLTEQRVDIETLLKSYEEEFSNKLSLSSQLASLEVVIRSLNKSTQLDKIDALLKESLKRSDRDGLEYLNKKASQSGKIDRETLKDWKKRVITACRNAAQPEFIKTGRDDLFSLFFENYDEHQLNEYRKQTEEAIMRARSSYQQNAVEKILSMVKEKGEDALPSWKERLESSKKKKARAEELVNKAKEESRKAFQKLSEKAIEEVEKGTNQLKNRALQAADREIEKVSRSMGALIGAGIGASLGTLGGPVAPLTVPVVATLGGLVGAVAPKVAEQILDAGASAIQRQLNTKLHHVTNYLNAEKENLDSENEAEWANFFLKADSYAYELATLELEKLKKIEKSLKTIRLQKGREAIAMIVTAVKEYSTNPERWNNLPSQQRLIYNSYQQAKEKAATLSLSLLTRLLPKKSKIPKGGSPIKNIKKSGSATLFSQILEKEHSSQTTPSNESSNQDGSLSPVPNDTQRTDLNNSSPPSITDFSSPNNQTSNLVTPPQEEYSPPISTIGSVTQEEIEAVTSARNQFHQLWESDHCFTKKETITSWIRAIYKIETLLKKWSDEASQERYHTEWKQISKNLLNYPLLQTPREAIKAVQEAFQNRRDPHEEALERRWKEAATTASEQLLESRSIYSKVLKMKGLSDRIREVLEKKENLALYRSLLYKAQSSLAEANLHELVIKTKENDSDQLPSLLEELQKSSIYYENVINKFNLAKERIGHTVFATENDRNKETDNLERLIATATSKKISVPGIIANIKADQAKEDFLKSSPLSLDDYNARYEYALKQAEEAAKEWEKIVSELEQSKKNDRSLSSLYLDFLERALLFKEFYQVSPLCLAAKESEAFAIFYADLATKSPKSMIGVFDQALEANFSAEKKWMEAVIHYKNRRSNIPPKHFPGWDEKLSEADTQEKLCAPWRDYLRVLKEEKIASHSYERSKEGIPFKRDGDNALFDERWSQAFHDARYAQEGWQTLYNKLQNYQKYLFKEDGELTSDAQLELADGTKLASYKTSYWHLRREWLKTEKFTEHQALSSRKYAFLLTPHDEELKVSLLEAVKDAQQAVDKTKDLLSFHQPILYDDTLLTESLSPQEEILTAERNEQTKLLEAWLVREEAHQKVLLAYQKAQNSDPYDNFFDEAWRNVTLASQQAAKTFPQLPYYEGGRWSLPNSTFVEDFERSTYWSKFYTMLPAWSNAQKAAQIAIAKQRSESNTQESEKLIAIQEVQKAWNNAGKEFQKIEGPLGLIFGKWNNFIDIAQQEESLCKKERTEKLQELHQEFLRAHTRTLGCSSRGSSFVYLSREFEKNFDLVHHHFDSFVKFHEILSPSLDEIERGECEPWLNKATELWSSLCKRKNQAQRSVLIYRWKI